MLFPSSASPDITLRLSLTAVTVAVGAGRENLDRLQPRETSMNSSNLTSGYLQFPPLCPQVHVGHSTKFLNKQQARIFDTPDCQWAQPLMFIKCHFLLERCKQAPCMHSRGRHRQLLLDTVWKDSSLSWFRHGSAIVQSYYLIYVEQCVICRLAQWGLGKPFSVKRGCFTNPTHVCLSLKTPTVGSVPRPTWTNTSPPEALLILPFNCQGHPPTSTHTDTHAILGRDLWMTERRAETDKRASVLSSNRSLWI